MRPCIDCRLVDRSSVQRVPHAALHPVEPRSGVKGAIVVLCEPGWGSFVCRKCGSFFIRQSPSDERYDDRPGPLWERIPLETVHDVGDDDD